MNRFKFAIICFFMLILPARADELMTIDMPTSILAGESLSILITNPTATAGDTIQATLLYGFFRRDELLVFGTGGIVNWQIPADELIQAGDALLIVGDVRQSLTILPKTPATIDLMTTANTIIAYGEGKAMIMMLVRDYWGNPITGRTTLTALFPDFTHLIMSLQIRDGLGWTNLSSVGGVGRTRIQVATGDSIAELELHQSPSYPAFIRLEVSPECLFPDGRDPLTLVTQVHDAHHQPVVDGTQVIFRWLGGEGYALTTDGLARLHIPAATHIGIHRYWALSGEARSRSQAISIQASCTP